MRIYLSMTHAGRECEEGIVYAMRALRGGMWMFLIIILILLVLIRFGSRSVRELVSES